MSKSKSKNDLKIDCIVIRPQSATIPNKMNPSESISPLGKQTHFSNQNSMQNGIVRPASSLSRYRTIPISQKIDSPRSVTPSNDLRSNSRKLASQSFENFDDIGSNFISNEIRGMSYNPSNMELGYVSPSLKRYSLGSKNSSPSTPRATNFLQRFNQDELNLIENENNSGKITVNTQTAPLCETPEIPSLTPIPISLLHDQLVHLKKKLHLYKLHILDSEAQLKALHDRNEILSMRLRTWRDFRKYVVSNEKFRPLKEFLDRWIEADPFSRDIGTVQTPGSEESESPSTPIFLSSPVSPTTPSSLRNLSSTISPTTTNKEIASRRISLSISNPSGIISELSYDERELKNIAWTKKLIEQSEIISDDTKLENFLKKFNAEYFMLHDLHSSPIGDYYIKIQDEISKNKQDEEDQKFLQSVKQLTSSIFTIDDSKHIPNESATQTSPSNKANLNVFELTKRDNIVEPISNSVQLEQAKLKITIQQKQIEKQEQEIQRLRDQIQKLKKIQNDNIAQVPTINSLESPPFFKRNSIQIIPLKGDITEDLTNPLISPRRNSNTVLKNNEFNSPQLEKRLDTKRMEITPSIEENYTFKLEIEEQKVIPTQATMILIEDEEDNYHKHSRRRSSSSKLDKSNKKIVDPKINTKNLKS